MISFCIDEKEVIQQVKVTVVELVTMGTSSGVHDMKQNMTSMSQKEIGREWRVE